MLSLYHPLSAPFDQCALHGYFLYPEEFILPTLVSVASPLLFYDSKQGQVSGRELCAGNPSAVLAKNGLWGRGVLLGGLGWGGGVGEVHTNAFFPFPFLSFVRFFTSPPSKPHLYPSQTPPIPTPVARPSPPPKIPAFRP